MRDADIFLAAFEKYPQWLPEDSRQHVKSVQGYLLRTRKSEQARFVQLLTGARYTPLIACWWEFTDSFETQEGAALLPFKDRAHERIRKLYKK